MPLAHEVRIAQSTKRENAKQCLASFIMDKLEKIFVAGHRGLVGSALIRRFEAEGFGNLVKRVRSQLDLADEEGVRNFFAQEKPAIVVFAARCNCC